MRNIFALMLYLSRITFSSYLSAAARWWWQFSEELQGQVAKSDGLCQTVNRWPVGRDCVCWTACAHWSKALQGLVHLNRSFSLMCFSEALFWKCISLSLEVLSIETRQNKVYLILKQIDFRCQNNLNLWRAVVFFSWDFNAHQHHWHMAGQAKSPIATTETQLGIKMQRGAGFNCIMQQVRLTQRTCCFRQHSH